MGQINQTLWQLQQWEKQILEFYVTRKPEFPTKYWEAYSTTPEPAITTSKPWEEKSGEPRKRYLPRKSDQLIKMMGKISKEKDIAKLNTTPLPEFYSTTPEPTTTTFRPWAKNSGKSRFLYVQRRAIELARVYRLMQKEKKMAKQSH